MCLERVPEAMTTPSTNLTKLQNSDPKSISLQQISKKSIGFDSAERLLQDLPHVSYTDVFLEPFGATWMIWVPFWTDLGSKGVPQVMFWGSCRKTDEKMFQFLIGIGFQNERAWEEKTSISHRICCSFRGAVKHRET